MVVAVNVSIHVSSWLTTHSQTSLFALNMSNTIQRQHVWKMRRICHLKHSLVLQWKRRSTNRQPRLNNYFACFLRVSRNLSSFTKTVVVFFKRPLLFNLITQIKIFTDTGCPNDQKFSNTIETDQYTTILKTV